MAERNLPGHDGGFGYRHTERAVLSAFSRLILKCHSTHPAAFFAGASLLRAGGNAAPSGHLSLIDEAHMWPPYVSWQGQRGAAPLEPGGPCTGTRRHSASTAAKRDEAGRDGSHQNPSLW